MELVLKMCKMVANKRIPYNQETVPLRKTKPKRKYKKKNPYHSVVLKGHSKKEIWSPAFQPVVVLKPLFSDQFLKLVMDEQEVKSATKRRKVDNLEPKNSEVIQRAIEEQRRCRREAMRKIREKTKPLRAKIRN